jgi:hypothetical protein
MPDKPTADPISSMQVDTPVIDMQDLEHQPGEATRVSNKGVKVTPSMDNMQPGTRKEVEEAIAELEKLEQSMRAERNR